MNQFEFDTKCEVVNDFAVDVLINIKTVLKQKKIDFNNENDILVKLYHKAIKLKRSIITNAETEKELEEINIKLKFINEFIKEL